MDDPHTGHAAASRAPRDATADRGVDDDRGRPAERELPSRPVAEPPLDAQERTFTRRIDCSTDGSDSYWGNART